jgi:hypothetical protein
LQDKTPIPAVPNELDPEGIADLADFSKDFDLRVVLGPVADPVTRYDSIDMQFFVNDVVTDEILDATFGNWERELPFAQNMFSRRAIEKMTDLPEVVDNGPFGEFDSKYMNALDTRNRRIDFDFPLTIDTIFSDWFPVEKNDVWPQTAERIVAAFDYFSFVESSSKPLMTDGRLFQEYIAPDEQLESLDDLAFRLAEQIYELDVSPEMPTEPVILIGNSTADKVVDNVFKEIFALRQVFPVGPPLIGFVRARNIPTIVRPDDIVDEILWEEALESLPLEPKTVFERFLDDI